MPQQFEPCLDEKGNKVPGFKRDVQSGIIYFLKMINGHYFRETTGQTDLKKAVKKANQIVADHFGGIKRDQIIQPLIMDEIKKIKDHYRKQAGSGAIARHTI